jgi:hypothetical protein
LSFSISQMSFKEIADRFIQGDRPRFVIRRK